MIQKLKHILSNKDIRILFNNFIALVLIKGVDFVIPLLVLPYIISTVGVPNYGIYAFVLSVVFYFFYISQYGFSLSAVRIIAQERNNLEKVNEVFNKVIWTKAFIFIVCTVILIVLAFTLNSIKDEKFLLFTAYLIVLGDVLNPTWLYRGMERMKFLTIVNVILKLTYVALVFLFIKKESDYIYIGLMQGIGFLLAGFVSFIMAFRIFNLSFIVISFRDVIMHLKSGFSSFVTLVIPMLYVNTSTFLLGIYDTSSHVAYFDGAYKVSNGFVSLNQIMTNVFYPFANRRSDKFWVVSAVLITVGCGMSLTCFLLADWVIDFLFGPEMKQSVIVLKILSLSPLFLSIRSAFGINYLLVENRDKLYMNIAVTSSIIAFLIGLFLIYYLDSTGAAIVVVFAQGLYSFLSMYFAIRIIKRKSLKYD